MGYTTDFEGHFTLDKPLRPEHSAYLRAFAETRRMARNPDKASAMPDPRREAVGLPIGEESGYFVGGSGFMGQNRDASVIDYNQQPTGQPGLWCKWVPTDDGAGIKWSGAEKFYSYVEWLNYLIDHFIVPWGYAINGAVGFQGEEDSDTGSVEIVDGRAVRVSK